MVNNIHIREIQVSDSEAIAKLSIQLDYTSDSEMICQQLISIKDKKDHYALVATDQEEIIGFIHGFLAIRITSSPFLEIGSLLVKEDHRRKGIGNLMLKEIKRHAHHSGKIRVRCNVKRKVAHQFYTALNYIELKEQKVFEQIG